MMIKAKRRARESHRPVTPVSNNIYIYIFLQRFFQSKHCKDRKVMFKDLQSTLFTLYGPMYGCTLTWPLNEKILCSVPGSDWKNTSHVIGNRFIQISNKNVQSSRESMDRLRVVPHFSSRIVERAKRERAWKSPHARDFHARSRFARSTILE